MGFKLILPTFLLFLLIFGGVGVVQAIPIIPQAFYGSVILNGNSAPDGTPVYACIDNVLKENTTTENGNYTIIVRGTESTDEINIYVCSLLTPITPYFTSGGVTQLNLIASGACTDKIPCSVEEPEDEDTTQDDNNGGGSSGNNGADIITTVNKSTILDEICYIFNLSQGKKIISINKSELALTKITFDVQKSLNNAEINISLLEKPPSYISSLDNVYKYLLIETNLKRGDIKNIIINFRISKSWLKQNKLNKTDAIFSRFYDGWSSLDTELVSEDDTFVYYKAETPYFSIFAISVREHIENPPPELIESPKENKTEINEDTGETSVSGINIYWIIGGGIIGVVCLVTILILLNKKLPGKKPGKTYKYKRVSK